MGKKKKPNPHRRANPELAAAMRELHQRHTMKARKGSRTHRRKRAIDDQKNALGE